MILYYYHRERKYIPVDRTKLQHHDSFGNNILCGVHARFVAGMCSEYIPDDTEQIH